MRFSEREKIIPLKNTIQLDSMDAPLRNGLWNVLYTSLLIDLRKPHYEYDTKLNNMMDNIWVNYFRVPIDGMPYNSIGILESLRTYFFQCKWNEVYDFIEYIAKYLKRTRNYSFDAMIGRFNAVMKSELSGYRFIDDTISKITSETEIKEIEEGLEKSKGLEPVYLHLSHALDKLSNRKSPDYRNSIKESISAVEAICNLIVKSESTTLSDALKEIEKKSVVQIHPALKIAFEKMYAYTSDADGIRHALMEKSDLDFEDAKYFLVSCSGFINYLLEKCRKSKITLR